MPVVELPNNKPGKPGKTVVSSVLLYRSERVRVTVKHAAGMSPEAVAACIGERSEQVDEEVPFGEGDVKFVVKEVTLNSDVCDIDDWQPTDLTAMKPDADLEDTEDEDSE